MKFKNLGLLFISLSTVLALGTLNLNPVKAQVAEGVFKGEVREHISVGKEMVRETVEKVEKTVESEEFQGHVAEPLINGTTGAAMGAITGGKRGAIKGGLEGTFGNCIGSCHDFSTVEINR